jgi:hypothetical protein
MDEEWKPSDIITRRFNKYGFGFMEFNAIFNNISIILWWSVLLVPINM